MKNPFRYFNSSPEVIRLAVMIYIRYPLSLRQVEDLLAVLVEPVWSNVRRGDPEAAHSAASMSTPMAIASG